MNRVERFACVVLLIGLGLLQAWSTQSPGEESTAAPVPQQIVLARTIFISHAGGGCEPFGRSLYSGGPARAYKEFYAAMEKWGRYKLVPSPADADLNFKLSYTCPPAGPHYYDTQLDLIMRDVKTHVLLWGITEHPKPANMKVHFEENFERAMQELVDDVKKLSSNQATAGKQAGHSRPAAARSSQSSTPHLSRIWTDSFPNGKDCACVAPEARRSIWLA